MTLIKAALTLPAELLPGGIPLQAKSLALILSIKKRSPATTINP